MIAPVTSHEIADFWRSCGCPPRCGGVPARWSFHCGRFTSGRHLSTVRIMLDRLLHYLAHIMPSQDEDEANMVVAVLACIVPASASTSRMPWEEVETTLHQTQLLLNITCFFNTTAVEDSTHARVCAWQALISTCHMRLPHTKPRPLEGNYPYEPKSAPACCSAAMVQSCPILEA